MDITPQNLDFLFKQFGTDFQRGFTARKQQWQTFAERVPSSTEMNTYGWLSELPGFREWIGGRILRNVAQRSYALVNKDWEDSFQISRNKIADDQFGIYSRHAELLGDASARLWDDLCIAALKAGNTTVAYDGQFFFDTDHPVDLDNAGAGTYSNSFASMPLTVENLGTLIATMQSYKGESGRSLQVQPSLLLCPPQLRSAAIQACKGASYAQAVRNVAGSEVVAAAEGHNPVADLVQPVVIHDLSDQPDVYYLLSTDRIKPLVLQVRKEPEIVARLDSTLDNVFYRKTFEYGADARGAVGYSLPFLAIRAKTTA